MMKQWSDGSLFLALSSAATLTMPSVLKMSKSPISSSVNKHTSVNVKRNLNLRYTFRRWRDANQIDVSKKLVVRTSSRSP